MREEGRVSYRFEQFQLNTEKHVLLENGEVAPLRPKAFDLLVLLVSHPGSVISKDEILQALWKGIHVSANVLDQTVRAVRVVLEDDSSKPRFIETVPKVGYRFIGRVDDAEAGTVPALKWQLAFVPVMYASLYAISVFVETRYQFDRFQNFAFFAAPAVFAGIAGTSVLALHLLMRGPSWRNLLLSCTIILFSALVVFLSLLLFLPDTPITLASFETHMARPAYFKNLTYYLAIAFGLIVPSFWYVQSLTAGRIASRVSAYIGLLLLAVIFLMFLGISISRVSDLIEHLRPNPYRGAFQLLVRTLLIIFFVLGVTLLVWCFSVLQRIERKWSATGSSQPAGLGFRERSKTP